MIAFTLMQFMVTSTFTG